ncbi:thioredoxin-2-like isoform X2 [Diachasmimorpha longicaudata]|uniref:thioredoxin-2-like isoform X2 n=1 Tax=Diachasmimorpha longicaudata TaxID=58733 RepID=UPI0030B8F20B
MVVIIENQNDLKKRLEEAGDKLVIIDFFATWCGPCKVIAPQFEELSKEHPDIVFLKVDVDDNEDIATEYEISSMPTFIFIKNNTVVHQFSGASLQKIQEGIQAHQN